MTIATVYNQHTVTSVSVGPTGHQHDRDPNLKDEEPTAIACDACSPYLAAEGWVFDPSLVPPTDRQIAQKETRDREGNAAVQQAAHALAEMSTRVVDQANKERRREEKQAKQQKPKQKPGPKPKDKKADQKAEQPEVKAPEPEVAEVATEPETATATVPANEPEPQQDESPVGDESSDPK